MLESGLEGSASETLLKALVGRVTAATDASEASALRRRLVSVGLQCPLNSVLFFEHEATLRKCILNLHKALLEILQSHALNVHALSFSRWNAANR